MKTSRQLKQIKRAFPQQRRSLKLNLCWFVFMSFGPSTDNINKWLTGFWLNYWISLSDATIHLDWFWKETLLFLWITYWGRGYFNLRKWMGEPWYGSLRYQRRKVVCTILSHILAELRCLSQAFVTDQD